MERKVAGNGNILLDRIASSSVVSKLDINRRKYYTLGATSFLYICISLLFDMIGQHRDIKRLKNYLIDRFNWNFSLCNFLFQIIFEGREVKNSVTLKKKCIFLQFEYIL